jgi:predicted DNA-binding transcriptional regulator YafY
MLERPAEIPESYDLEAHFAGARQVTGGRRQQVSLRVRGVAAQRLASARVHPSQAYIATGPDEARLTLRVALTEELRAWVLSLGAEAEMLAPRQLRRQVAETARAILANYSAD